MHFPEAALHTGGFGSLGGDQSVWVRLRRQRPLPKNNAQVFAELTFNLFEFGIIPGTSAALKVTKLFQNHRRTGVATDVWWFGAFWFGGRIAGVCIRVRVRRLSRQSHE